MNLENVNYSIDLLKSQKEKGAIFSVMEWQDSGDKLCTSIKEFNECGTVACLGGLISMSEKWKSDGHGMALYGIPCYYIDGEPAHEGSDAISSWLEIPFYDGNCLCHTEEDSELYVMHVLEIGYDEVIGVLETLRDTGSVWGGE